MKKREKREDEKKSAKMREKLDKREIGKKEEVEEKVWERGRENYE